MPRPKKQTDNETEEPARAVASESSALWTAIEKLTKQMKSAGRMLSLQEARFLVDLYYQLQDARIRAAGQIRSIRQGVDLAPMQEGDTLLLHFFKQFEALEKQMKDGLEMFAIAQRPGRWCKQVKGLGPIITAGLLANIDITKAPHAGSIWKFAGICSPSVDKWNKGEKRPWNADFKSLCCYLLGESFVKCKTRDGDFYGHLFDARRAQYAKLNMEGAYIERCGQILQEKKWDTKTESYAWYSGRVQATVWQDYYSLKTTEERQDHVRKYKGGDGYGQPMIPPAHLHRMAVRIAVKMFLSHLHEVMFECHYDRKPEKPWIIDRGGHVDYVPPPGWPVE